MMEDLLNKQIQELKSKISEKCQEQIDMCTIVKNVVEAKTKLQECEAMNAWGKYIDENIDKEHEEVDIMEEMMKLAETEAKLHMWKKISEMGLMEE